MLYIHFLEDLNIICRKSFTNVHCHINIKLHSSWDVCNFVWCHYVEQFALIQFNRYNIYSIMDRHIQAYKKTSTVILWVSINFLAFLNISSLESPPPPPHFPPQGPQTCCSQTTELQISFLKTRDPSSPACICISAYDKATCGLHANCRHKDLWHDMQG